MAKDPVCGKELDELEADISEVYEGHEYFFCSLSCKQEFDRRPDLYSGEGLSPGIQYPMDVEPL